MAQTALDVSFGPAVTCIRVVVVRDTLVMQLSKRVVLRKRARQVELRDTGHMRDLT